MGSHPNAILMLVLTPDDAARKTHRAIVAECGVDDDEDIKIGEHGYSHRVMESDYDENWQISAEEGDIVLHDFLTYGYGENVEWSKVEERKAALAEWATGICERHRCTHKIYITANHW